MRAEMPPAPSPGGRQRAAPYKPDSLGGNSMTTAEITASGLSETEHSRQLRRALIASTVGTTIEWYDFLLYGQVTGRVRAHPVRIPDGRGDHIAARRMERLADATLPRASAARAVAVRLDAVLVHRGQRAVARLGDGDRLRGAIVHDPAVDRDPQGAGRHPPVVGAYGRVCRRPDDHPSRHRHSDLRRA